MAWRRRKWGHGPSGCSAQSRWWKQPGNFDLEIVVKPHPLDAIALSVPGSTFVGRRRPGSSGTQPYGLLAASHSLVTDYSSIWTDYLSTGKHVAFAVADWDDYRVTRGLDESVERSALPGPVVESADEIRDVLPSSRLGGRELERQRDRTIESLGLVTEEGNCRRLTDQLARRGIRSWSRVRPRESAPHRIGPSAAGLHVSTILVVLSPVHPASVARARVTSAEWAGLGTGTVRGDGGSRRHHVGLASSWARC